MLQPLRQSARQQTAIVAPQAAPTMGWNTQRRLADLTPEYAIELDNFIPQRGRLDVRKGFASHATGLGAPVETLMVHDAAGSITVFGAADGNIFDVTSSGAVGTAAVSSLTNDRWQWINFTTSGGAFLLCVNGADGVRSYNGSSWATEAITGVTAADLIDVWQHKERVWFIEKDTMSAWYLAALNKSGAATEFPLGAVFSRGGSLQVGASWTRDGGSGPDDYIVFISDRGQAAIYAGTDPGEDFALVGVYEIGAPIGRRCVEKAGGDLVVQTDIGAVPLSTVMPATTPENVVTPSVLPAFRDEAGQHKSKFGWQILNYPKGGLLICNIPQVTNSEYAQFVMNLINGAWCRFVGVAAISWALAGDEIYFGAPDGTVYQFDTGTSDAGSNIEADVFVAFSRYGYPGKKRFTGVRTYFLADAAPDLLLEMKVDFDDSPANNEVQTTSTVQGSAWDVADWDDALWGGGKFSVAKWAGVTGVGTFGGIRLRVATNSTEISLTGFDVAFEAGGVL